MKNLHNIINENPSLTIRGFVDQPEPVQVIAVAELQNGKHRDGLNPVFNAKRDRQAEKVRQWEADRQALFDDSKTINAVSKWLSKQVKAESFNRKTSTVGFAGIASNALDMPVSHGAFIAGSMLAGFDSTRKRGSPSAFIKLWEIQ